MVQPHLPELTRRTLLQATTGTVAAVATGERLRPARSAGPARPARSAGPARPAGSASVADHGAAFRELDARIRSGMARYGIPGVAVGVLSGGTEYLRGYGVTNVDYPVDVDEDTVFRVASTTKTFTGTSVMRLVEDRAINLDATVRSYLPTFRTSDPSVAARVTVRQLLNHSAGWLGDYFEDTGQGDDAVARYVAGVARLPQLTAPGTVFAYNNAALSVAGRVIEAVTGAPYETALRGLLLDPLGLAHSRFFADEVIGFNVAAPHDVVDGRPVVQPSFYRIPRGINPAGGLISSVRDQLRYARFHCGDGRVPDGRTRLLTQRSLLAMRSRRGPGGTLFVELDGMGVTWMLRPSAEGVRVLQHGGDLPGQHSGFLMVPDRGFALTMLTNSEAGPALLNEFFVDDWALRRFAGVSNLPASPQRLSTRALAPFVGDYTGQRVGVDGVLRELTFPLTAERGELVTRIGGQVVQRLAFYRPDHVLVLDENGRAVVRADFVRRNDGSVAWLRLGGRLYRHGTRGNEPTARRVLMPPPLLPYLS